MSSKKWDIHHGDCIPHMAEEMEPNSVDMVVCSVPFPAMFAYTSDAADLGMTMSAWNRRSEPDPEAVGDVGFDQAE